MFYTYWNKSILIFLKNGKYSKTRIAFESTEKSNAYFVENLCKSLSFILISTKAMGYVFFLTVS